MGPKHPNSEPTPAPHPAADETFDALLRGVARVSWAEHAAKGQVLTNGTQLVGNRFEILRKIGEGGMGVVYEGQDRVRCTPVAIKTLGRVDAAGIYHLKREFRSLAHVVHPNLVGLHELFADDELWFFTMDLVPGQPFTRWLDAADGAVAREQRIRRGLGQLIEAVCAIHQAGRLHCDLKPSNVLVDEQGQLVVLDFGLATELVRRSESAPATPPKVATHVVGTPSYMAPEQAAGAHTAESSDWYAVGVMLFEALTGRLPFLGGAQDIMEAKQSHRAPSPRPFVPDGPADLVDACEALLAQDPCQRPDGPTLQDRFARHAHAAAGRSSIPASPRASLVGRKRELDALHAAFSASVEGTRPVITMLSGESGIGKSSLMAQFSTDLRQLGDVRILQGRCYEQESVPFKAFDVLVDDLYRQLAEFSEEGVAEIAPRDAWAVGRLFPVLGRLAAFAQGPDLPDADPHEIRRRGFLGLGVLLRRLRGQGPLVIHIDDLQWTDQDSITLILHLLRQVDAPNLLFVACHRDGWIRSLDPLYDTLEHDIRVDFRRLPIQPLPHADARRVAGVPLSASALAEANGNPFLLHELSRYATSHGPVDLAKVSLSTMLAQRCRQLPPRQQRLLHAARLSAGPVPQRVALAATGADASDVDSLRARQLIRSGTRKGEIECFHDRLREGLSGACTRLEAKALHHALADAWIVDSPEHAEPIALHYDGAGQSQLAAEYAVVAADRAALNLGFNRAARLYDLALTRGRFEAAATERLQLSKADALANAGRSVDAAETTVATLADAPVESRARMARRAGGFYLQSGRLAAGIPLVNQGLKQHGLRIPKSETGALASLLVERGRLRARGYTTKGGPPSARHAARFAAAEDIAYALMRLDPLRYAALATPLVRVALASGDARIQARGMAFEAWTLTILGQPRQRIEQVVRRGQQLVARTGDPIAHFWLEMNLANAAMLEDPDQSLRHSQTCQEILAAHPEPSISFLGPSLTWTRQYAMCLKGEFASVAKAMPALLDDAWARDDLGLAPFLATVPGAVARVAVEDLTSLDHDLARAQSGWERSAFAWQDIMLAQGNLIAALYRRDVRRAEVTAQGVLAKAKGSLAYRAAPVKAYVQYLGAWVHLAQADQLPEGSHRDAILGSAERAISFHQSLEALSGTWPSPLGTGLKVLQGKREEAVAELRSALTSPTGTSRLPAYQACAEFCLGELLDTDEGAHHRNRAKRFLVDRGVVNPRRFVSTLVPGLVRHGPARGVQP